ncbi:S8 family peptidase [Leisingera sp. M527]|uniref:S8 family peptidase n=1 Tax=Leisingera sp. M527 TaxID=2867014 RepID=UPI0021A8D307|nr:S8 family peptidase [Leisingera sp. M527]UWQ32064.1 S8 family peptidase [Leisingera sp. M527]
MASPIQIVLNQENFEEVRDKSPGGSKTDFFAYRDQEFSSHKQNILSQLASISSVLSKQETGDTGFIKVVLRKAAWAKSHRPFAALLKPERIPLVGGGDLGELLLEATPQRLSQVAQAVSKAETNTLEKYDPNKRKEVPNPSSFKSEVGAISKIELFSHSDKRDFTVSEAIAWLSNPMTGSSYHIDLFEIPAPRAEWDLLHPSKRRLFTSFFEGLSAVGPGLDVRRLRMTGEEPPLLSFRLGQSEQMSPFRISSSVPSGDRQRSKELAPFDDDASKHAALLEFLDNHPLVRRVELPPIISRTVSPLRRNTPSGVDVESGSKFDLPPIEADRSYPVVGIIDGGIGDHLAPWTLDKWDVLAEVDSDLDHGTFIGGLTVAGNALNGPDVCPERDGVALVDIAVLPNEAVVGSFENYYPNGLTDFFDEIEQAVGDTSAQHGARVFNMSLNIQRPATPSRYERFASILDGIAEEHNALFVLSAGNTDPHSTRAEWSTDSTQAAVDLSSARNDGLLMPAESIRNVAVAALNPPGLDNIVPYAPANYSCRGPGVRAGVKPDLAQIGGSGTPHHTFGHGLSSIKPDGVIVDGCGTSYAAPLVAKTAAILDHNIEGDVSRETLVALLLHHASIPDALDEKALRPLARDLVGFGMTAPADEILQGNDHQITLVFASRIQKEQQIEFGFAWPASLVLPGGKCRGKAKLTVVSTPPLDSRFGSEFVRVNLNATLQQEEPKADGTSGWLGRLDPIYSAKDIEGHRIEAERIKHDLKWSPVKGFEKTMPRGKGKSSNWRLFVEYLTRSSQEIPDEGIPFTAVLTISDPDKKAFVFDEMRQTLQSTGVQIADIRTAARIASRI